MSEQTIIEKLDRKKEFQEYGYDPGLSQAIAKILNKQDEIIDAVNSLIMKDRLGGGL